MAAQKFSIVELESLIMAQFNEIDQAAFDKTMEVYHKTKNSFLQAYIANKNKRIN